MSESKSPRKRVGAMALLYGSMAALSLWNALPPAFPTTAPGWGNAVSLIAGLLCARAAWKEVSDA